MTRLIDPKIMIAIRDLALAAKTTVDGFLAGIHNSNVKGVGMEFSQYRSYQAGDDLRRLDWKLFARSDRYYIRESEIETSISVKFLIDASASMNHEDTGISKIEFARYLAASLAWLAHLQGDETGLHVFRDNTLFSLPARKDHQHLSRIFFQLEQIDATGNFTESVNYKSLFTTGARKELLIFITDYYEKGDEISKLLHSLASNRHEIIVFHLMGKNELDLSFPGNAVFEDFETGRTITVNAEKGRRLYQEKLQKHLEKIRTELLDKKIFYRLLKMDEPIEVALRDFLIRRNK